jgi:hypothetical protein
LKRSASIDAGAASDLPPAVCRRRFHSPQRRPGGPFPAVVSKWLAVGLAVGLLTIPRVLAASEGALPAIRFNTDIRPLLSQHCIACHGPDEEDRQSDLRLDSFEEATADLGGYSAIAPGDPDASALIERVTTDDDDLRMPPADHGEALTSHQVALLRQWIREGGTYQAHWAFVPPAQTTPPAPRPGDRVHNPIDAFVLARVHDQGLRQNPPASPRSLVRRVSLDLTGLPPLSHPASCQRAIDEYLSAPTAESFSRLVDALLATDAYAEHWAAMWLDIARYADTVGYSGDEPRDIWPWRDWLIRAIGANKSYEQFTTEMLAGDLLPDATDDERLATAFHRNTLNNNEGGTNDEQFRVIAVKDRISTTVNAWMGLTLRCAECHTHKYDPISQQEYYQTFAFFNQTADADHNDDRPRLAVYPDGRQRLRAKQQAQLEELLQKRTTQPDSLDGEIDQLQAEIDGPVRVPVLEELPADSRRRTFVMARGNFQSPLEEVTARFPEQLHAMPADTPANRLGVARWLFADANPLTARVAVNRYWARLFGLGIVETEEDFGTQGAAPTHPELLDWLAVDFRENGWDVKRLLKQMVTSATYQQSPTVDPDALAADPRNLWLSRGPRLRLPAEVVRDQALAVAGLLTQKLYGPPVYPPSPIKRIVNAFTAGMTWVESEGEDRYRRTLYTFLKRSQPHPLLETFDMATRETCSMRRLRTNTPLQSFATLNDITFIEAARALAERMTADFSEEATTDAADRSDAIASQIARGLELALFVEADPRQVEVLHRLYQRIHDRYEHDLPAAALMIDRSGFDPAACSADAAQAHDLLHRASMTVVANVILNLDRFLNN